MNWTFLEYLEARRRVETASVDYQSRAQELATRVLNENAAKRTFLTVDAMWERVVALAKEGHA